MWPRVPPPRGRVAKIKISRFSFTTYAWLIPRCNYRGGGRALARKGRTSEVQASAGETLKKEGSKGDQEEEEEEEEDDDEEEEEELSCRGNEILTDFIVGWRKQFANVNTCWILSAARERELEGPHTLRPVYPLNLWLPPPTAASTHYKRHTCITSIQGDL